MRTLALAFLTAALLAVAAAPADAAFKSCPSIRNVSQLNGTRFAGSDIFRIRAQGVSYTTARRIARGATLRALGITPPLSGIKRFRYQSGRSATPCAATTTATPRPAAARSASPGSSATPESAYLASDGRQR